jgi:hypothetical protein
MTKVMLFQSRFMPCPECGASVDQVEDDQHVCEDERRLTYQLFHLRGEIEELDDALARYLESPRGRFEQWYAERTRPD